MVRVELPNGKSFSMDGYLAKNLDILVNKISKDFDFMIIVSGSGTVRIGKSVFAMQIGSYLAKNVAENYNKKYLFDINHNFAFRGDDLIKKANWLHENYGFGGVLVYDEAGADLHTQKIYTPLMRTLMDFFRECGQMNLFLILVIPDFFDLPKGIAISRSIGVANVRFKEDLKRGAFSFFNFKQKKDLYIKGKKFCNYRASKPSFFGEFWNKYPVDEVAYRELKANALKTNIDKILGRKRDAVSKYHIQIYKQQINALLNSLWDLGVTNKQINELMSNRNAPSFSFNRLSKIRKSYKPQAILEKDD